MTAAAANPGPPTSPAEIRNQIARAGLSLNPGQVADLVLAWRQVAAIIAEMPRERGFDDDMALVFRLPPPVDTPPPEAKSAAVPKKKASAASTAPAQTTGKRKAAAK